jgi:hypothetical protein
MAPDKLCARNYKRNAALIAKTRLSILAIVDLAMIVKVRLSQLS